MSEYEDYLIREATEGPSFQEVHEDYLEPDPVEPNDSNETGDQQGETTLKEIIRLMVYAPLDERLRLATTHAGPFQAISACLMLAESGDGKSPSKGSVRDNPDEARKNISLKEREGNKASFDFRGAEYLIQESLVIGKFNQARKQCEAYGLDYELQRQLFLIEVNQGE